MTSSTRRTQWAAALLIVVLLGGTAMAVRLVRHHDVQVYGDAMAALGNCPQNETINCEIVNTSAWSEMFGVPIAAFAIPTYLLVLGLVFCARRDETLFAYAFSIGLLAVAYSGFLFWVSSTRIGFLCLWCMGLYAINLSIPILTGLAAWRSPASLVGRTLRHLGSWPAPLRRTAAAFVLLLVATVGVEQAYRGVVAREAAAERARIEEQGGPLLPALPPDDAATPAAPAPGSAPDGNPAGGPQAPADRPDSSGGLRLPIAPAGSGPAPLAAILGLDAAVVSVAAPAGSAPGAAQPGATPGAAGPYRLAGPLRRISGTKEKLVVQPFDLQARLGRGKPVALIFWAPDYPEAERELVIMSRFFAQALPQFEVYAVSGRLDEQQDEEIWERFSMLELSASLPLLIDDTFVVSKAMTVTDVPDVAVFDAKGVLLVAKIKDPSQGLVSSQGRLAAAEFLQKVASGAAVEPIKNMFPYYPSSLLVGRCAPAFTARKFNTTENYTFTGKSASGKPTLLMFWSSTCKHCQQEIPQMVDWIKKHPGVVDVVSVTHLKREDGNDAAHRKVTEAYIREQHIPWLVLEDPDNAIGELYGSDSTPTTYIIGPGSKIAEIWYYAHSGNYGPAIEEALGKARAVTPCQPAPPHPEARLDFTVAAPDGKRVPIASLVDRPALVHFWATWCAPCVAELPSLLRLRNRLEKSGAARVVLVSVEAESDGPKIAAFEKKQGLDLRSYRAPAGGVADKVDLAHRVPRTYLVGAGGTVLSLRQGSQSWDDPALAARIESRLEVLGGGAKR